jgi:oligoendopeptidase F
MTDYVEAEDAAFTIYLPSYDRPFCYFGPGYQSVFTVAHEMGHYYSGLYIGLENTPLDLDEIYSQANEMLLLDYLKDELSPNVYQALEIYQLSNILNTIVVGTIVDEIEETVYSLNYKPLTVQTLDVIISEVCDNYGGIEFLNTNIFSRGVNEYFREVSVRQPIYYLSYATSAVSSLALYKNAKDDRDSARDKYKVLVENVDVTLGLKKCLSRAEFSSPFSEETFTSIVELF